MDFIDTMIKNKMQEFSQLVSSVIPDEGFPQRARRTRIDSARRAYDSKSSQSEIDLIEVETAVDELRRDAVERRYNLYNGNLGLLQ